MELIVIHEWHRNGSKMESFNVESAVKQVLETLVNSKRVRAQWNSYYKYNDYKGRAEEVRYIFVSH